MNIKDFANMLNNREYRNELTSDEEQMAKELGFVIIFGASDDLIEFRGALSDERDCYSGGLIYLDKDGLFEECECMCKYSELAKKHCKTIEAIWYKDEIPWTYKTDIVHEVFNILEDGDIYCKGIIFQKGDIYE